MVVDYSQPPRMVHFNGANPLDWVSQVERYYFVYSISDSIKLPLASFFLEGDARRWFGENQFRNWDDFVDQLFDRYRNWTREEPDKHLVALDAEHSIADHMFTEMPLTTASLQSHDRNTCVGDAGNLATHKDQVFDEIPQRDSSIAPSQTGPIHLLMVPSPDLDVLFDIVAMESEDSEEDVSANSTNQVFNLSSLPSEIQLLDITLSLTLLESAVKVGKSEEGIAVNIRVEGFEGAVPFSITWFDTGQGIRFPMSFTVKCDSSAFVMFDNQQALHCLLFAYSNHQLLHINLDKVAGKVSDLVKYSIPAEVLSVESGTLPWDGEFALTLKQLSLRDFPRSVIVNDYDILLYTPLHKLHPFGNSSYHPDIHIQRRISCIVVPTLIIGLSEMIIPSSFFLHYSVTVLHPLLFQLAMIGSTLHGRTNDKLNLSIELIQAIVRAGQITYYVILMACHQEGWQENEAIFFEVMEWDKDLCTVTSFSYALNALVVNRPRDELFLLLESHKLGWCELLDKYSVPTMDCVQDTFLYAMRNTCVLIGHWVMLWDIRDSFIFHLSHGGVDNASIHPQFVEVFDELCVLTDETNVFDPCAHSTYYVAMRVFERAYQLQEFTGATIVVVYTSSRTCAFVLPFEDNEVWGGSWGPIDLNGIAKVGLIHFLGSFLDFCAIYIECLLRTFADHLLANVTIYYNLISWKLDAATFEAGHKFFLVLTAFGLDLEDWRVKEQSYFHSTTCLVVYISFSSSPFAHGIHDILINGLVQQNRMFDPGGMHRETKFCLFSAYEDHSVSPVQLNGICYAQQAIFSGYSTGGLASIMHCNEFTILLPSSTKVKCLSEVMILSLFLYISAKNFRWCSKKRKLNVAEEELEKLMMAAYVKYAIAEVLKPSSHGCSVDYLCWLVIVQTSTYGLAKMEHRLSAHARVKAAKWKQVMVWTDIRPDFSTLSLLLSSYSNLEDKVLIEDGSNVMNVNTFLEGTLGNLENYLWDPG